MTAAIPKLVATEKTFFLPAKVLKKNQEKAIVLFFYALMQKEGPRHAPGVSLKITSSWKNKLPPPPASRNYYRYYRVLKQASVDFCTPGKIEILWDGGTNLPDLCNKHPRWSDSRKDDLYPKFSSDEYPVKIWFECKKLDGEGWQRCDDPRPIECEEKK